MWSPARTSHQHARVLFYMRSHRNNSRFDLQVSVGEMPSKPPFPIQQALVREAVVAASKAVTSQPFSNLEGRNYVGF